MANIKCFGAVLVLLLVVATSPPALAQRKYFDLTLTSTIQEGDTIVVKGKFMSRMSRINFYTSKNNCMDCRPMSVTFMPRRHRIQVDIRGSGPKQIVHQSRRDAVKQSGDFQFMIRVRANSFEMKLNKKKIANVTMAPEVYGKIVLIRCYSAWFDNVYVFGNDLNKPAIHNSTGENFWGVRPGFEYEPTVRIIGGTDAITGEFPWLAAFRKKNSTKWTRNIHLCGATIVSSCWLISAAHCFNSILSEFTSQVNTFYDQHHIRVGDYHNGNNGPLGVRDPYEEDFEIEKIILHPEYKPTPTPPNDIALIKLKKKIGKECIHFNKYVQPIMLPPKGQLLQVDGAVGTPCHVAGFGSKNASSPIPSVLGTALQKTKLELKPFKYCNESYGINSHGDDKMAIGMFCAEQKGHDTCKGDSGGPITCNRHWTSEKNMVLDGVTSWGEGCDKSGAPGVYTDLRYFMDWIIGETGATANKSPPRHLF